eukprot:5452979-Heterocapsa_arctica.AAC.1
MILFGHSVDHTKRMCEELDELMGVAGLIYNWGKFEVATNLPGSIGMIFQVCGREVEVTSHTIVILGVTIDAR